MGARSPDVPYPSFTLAMVQSGYSPHSSRKKKGARRGRHPHPNRSQRPDEFMVRACLLIQSSLVPQPTLPRPLWTIDLSHLQTDLCRHVILFATTPLSRTDYRRRWRRSRRYSSRTILRRPSMVNRLRTSFASATACLPSLWYVFTMFVAQYSCLTIQLPAYTLSRISLL